MTSIPDSAPTLLPGTIHTTRLPAHVERAALKLLASGRIADQMRAAQMLAAAYADDEAQRLGDLKQMFPGSLEEAEE